MVRCSVLSLFLATLLFGGLSYAQQPSYPQKMIRIVVPFAAGGSNDVFARAVSERLPAALGQQAIIDNRPGAGSATGTAFVAKSPADGYTLLTVSSTLTTMAAMQPNLPYNVVTDFAPIGLIARSALGLFVHPSLPVRNVQDLIRLAKARPKELNYATSGVGGINHFATEMFQSIAKIKLTHVPYKGNAPALTDVMGGHVQLMISSLPPALQHMRIGRLRALAVSSAERSKFVPDLPTMTESGVSGYSADLWWGLVAPAHTPDVIIRRVNTELQKILAAPDLRQRFSGEAAIPSPITPEEFAAVINRDLAMWKKVVVSANIKPE